MYWWTQQYGPFPPEDSQARYPHPGAVVKCYRKRARMTLRSLAKYLQCSHSMAKWLEESIGLDLVSRRRELCRILTIPSALLGLADEHVEHPGKIVKAYRQRKRWKQRDLAEAMDVTEVTIRSMENYHRGLDSISRRRALAFLLSIPLAELGLDGNVHETTVTAGSSVTKRLHTDLLVGYQGALSRLWRDFFVGHDEATHQATKLASQLYSLVPHLASEERPRVLELAAMFEQYMINVAREICDYETVYSHADQVVAVARQLGHPDLLAQALTRRAMAAFEQGDPHAATPDIEAALAVSRHATPYVRGDVLLESGMILAHAGRELSDMRAVHRFMDQSGKVVQSLSGGEEDRYFLRFDIGFYHMRRARMLIGLARQFTQMKKQLAREALDELELAGRKTDQTFSRRQAIVNLLRAQAYAELDEYPEATHLALQALPVFQQIRSQVNAVQVGRLYQELLASSYGESPRVARLGWELADSQ